MYREGERGGTRDCKKSACTNQQDTQNPGSTATSTRGVPSRKHKTGTAVLVLTSHLSSAFSKSTDKRDQASFPSTDTVITTKKNLSLRLLTAKSSTGTWVPGACGSSARRRSKLCDLVLRHFLVGAAGGARSRDDDVRARAQGHLDAIFSLLALAQTSAISPRSLETDLYVRFLVPPPPPPPSATSRTIFFSHIPNSFWYNFDPIFR